MFFNKRSTLFYAYRSICTQWKKFGDRRCNKKKNYVIFRRLGIETVPKHFAVFRINHSNSNEWWNYCNDEEKKTEIDIGTRTADSRETREERGAEGGRRTTAASGRDVLYYLSSHENYTNNNTAPPPLITCSARASGRVPARFSEVVRFVRFHVPVAADGRRSGVVDRRTTTERGRRRSGRRMLERQGHVLGARARTFLCVRRTGRRP